MVKYAVIYAVYFTVAWSTTQNKYGIVVIYAIYFTMAWSTTRNKYGSASEFSVFSVVGKMHWRLASVGLAQACPNYLINGVNGVTKNSMLRTSATHNECFDKSISHQ